MINPPICDSTNTEEEVTRLFNENQRLIGYFVERNSAPQHMTYDEYHSELCIALWKSCRTYDSSIAQFSTYAYRGMWMARGRLIQKYKRSIKATDVTKVPEDLSCESEVHSIVTKLDCIKVIDELASYLTINQKHVLYLMLAGYSPKQIGLKLNRSSTTISERYRHCVRRMRKIAERKGIKCPI